MKQYLYVTKGSGSLMVYTKMGDDIRYISYDGTWAKSSNRYLPGEPIEIDFI